MNGKKKKKYANTPKWAKNNTKKTRHDARIRMARPGQKWGWNLGNCPKISKCFVRRNHCEAGSDVVYCRYYILRRIYVIQQGPERDGSDRFLRAFHILL